MTIYNIIKQSKTNVQSKSRQHLIDKLAQGLKLPTSEIKAELEELENNGHIKPSWDGKYYTVQVVERKETKHKDTEIVQAPPIAYKIYNYFKESCVGVGNAQSMSDIATWFGVSERELRDIIYRINFRGYTLKNGVTFTRKIKGDNKGYFMIANEEEKKQFRSKRVRKLLNAVKELKITDEDFGHDNQFKLSLSEWEKDLVKSISTDL